MKAATGFIVGVASTVVAAMFFMPRPLVLKDSRLTVNVNRRRPCNCHKRQQWNATGDVQMSPWYSE